MTTAHRSVVVLLVDDQAFIGIAVGRLLGSEQDIELHCCTRSSEAIEQANRVGPAVILQDLVMPEIDGIKLVELYRANPKTSHTPIIVLSGNEDADGRERAFAAGANDYLVKLPPQDVLVACIRRHAAGNTVPGGASTRPAVAPPKSSGETLDRNTVATLRQVSTADSSDFFGSLVDQFLTEAATRLDMLKRSAFARDVPGLKTTAHSLKGSSNTMGATRLAVLCAELESHLKSHPDGADVLPLVAELGEELDRVRNAFSVERQGVHHPVRL